ncbi:MAG: TRAP transporter small permease [Deltaproteobacteria bacterium]|nr:TRAP transporter small permease [Deltaproteobacteria bacterium]
MFLTKVDRGIAKVESLVLTLLVTTMILLSAYQVLARNWGVFHQLPESLLLKMHLGIGSSWLLPKLKAFSEFCGAKLPPLVWGDAVVRSLVLWVGFVGASIAAHEGGHLAIDFINHLTPTWFKRYSSLVTSLASAVVCYFLMLAAYKFFQDEKLSESFLIPNLVPNYWAVVIIPFGFLMMMLRFGIKAVESIHSLIWSKE